MVKKSPYSQWAADSQLGRQKPHALRVAQRSMAGVFSSEPPAFGVPQPSSRFRYTNKQSITFRSPRKLARPVFSFLFLPSSYIPINQFQNPFLSNTFVKTQVRRPCPSHVSPRDVLSRASLDRSPSPPLPPTPPLSLPPPRHSIAHQLHQDSHPTCRTRPSSLPRTLLLVS